MTIGALVPEDKPLIWRGPMAHGAFKQLLIDNTIWPELEYQIVDLPPGTGDVPLTLCQLLPLTGAVVVATPQQVALDDAIRAVRMFQQLNAPVLGMIENMSYFGCPHCGGKIDVFGHGEGQQMAKMFELPFLGEIEIDPKIRIGGDTGKPVASLGEDAPGAKSMYAMARQVAARISVVNLSAPAPVVQIL